MTTKSYTRAFDIGSLTDQGRRSNNEDTVLRVEDWDRATQSQRHTLGRLYVVADGVGGNDNGEVASDLVVKGLMQHYYDESVAEGTSPIDRLRRAVELTTREISDESLRRDNNMRSTVVAALILDPDGQRERRRLVLANVGDSPAILFRKGQPPRKLSQDHVRRDQTLSQAMGDEVVNVAMFNEPLQIDDVVVICSDGLSDGERGPVTPKEIERVIRGTSAQAASAELVRLAKRKGSSDNISAVVIRNGDRPPPLRMIMQSVLALLFLALLGGGIYAAGFVKSGGSSGTGGPGGIPNIFAPTQGNGDALASTATMMPPTDTPLPTNTSLPTLTPRPNKTPMPVGTAGAATTVLTNTLQVVAPAVDTATPVIPTATPVTPEPTIMTVLTATPMPTPKPHKHESPPKPPSPPPPPPVPPKPPGPKDDR